MVAVSRLPVKDKGRGMAHFVQEHLKEHLRLTYLLPQQNVGGPLSRGIDVDSFTGCAQGALPNDRRMEAAVEDGVVEDVEQSFGQFLLAAFETRLPVG